MRLFEEILCPIDFSESSVKALQWTEYLASEFGSNVTALHVHVPEYATGTGLGGAPYSYNYDPSISIGNAMNQLKTFLAPLKITSEPVVATGNPATEIVRLAKEMKTTMIVMGTHGHKGLAHTLLGSTTEEIIRKAAIPVFTVSPNATLRTIDTVKTALVPISNTKALPTNFETIRGILDEFGEALTLMNVVDHHDDMFGVNFHASPYVVTAYETTEKEKDLLKIGEALKGKDIVPLIKFGDAAEEILKESLNPKYGYLLLAVKKEKTLPRFFQSTAYRVISKSTIPVITVKFV